MMMSSWLARPLRRFLGTAVMVIGGQAFIHRLLFPLPELPPARVDRVVVEGNRLHYEIRDPAAVRRIVAFVRGPKEGNAVRIPDRMYHPSEVHRVAFYRGDRREEGTIVWAPRLISARAGRHQHILYFLTAREGAELQRLLQQ